MALLLLPLWLFGGAAAGILGAAAGTDRPHLAAIVRISYGLVLTAELLASAVAFSAAESNPDSSARGSQSGWWLYALAGGVLLSLLTAAAVRSAYPRRARLVPFAAALLASGLYLGFPLGFVPGGDPLTGLGLWEHRHHSLDVLLLLVPLASLLGWELWRVATRRPHHELDHSDLVA